MLANRVPNMPTPGVDPFLMQTRSCLQSLKGHIGGGCQHLAILPPSHTSNRTCAPEHGRQDGLNVAVGEKRCGAVHLPHRGAAGHHRLVEAGGLQGRRGKCVTFHTSWKYNPQGFLGIMPVHDMPMARQKIPHWLSYVLQKGVRRPHTSTPASSPAAAWS